MQRTSGGAYNRKAGAKARLEAQLKSGKKLVNTKEGTILGTVYVKVDLTESDIKRINKEIEALDKKLK